MIIWRAEKKKQFTKKKARSQRSAGAEGACDGEVEGDLKTSGTAAGRSGEHVIIIWRGGYLVRLKVTRGGGTVSLNERCKAERCGLIARLLVSNAADEGELNWIEC